MRIVLIIIWWLLLVGCAERPAHQNVFRGSSGSSIREERGLQHITPQVAVDGKRVALVIGNSNYKNLVNNLPNPLHDAEDIARDLRGFGFDVQIGRDLSNEKMRDIIADFGRRASNADVALFYYAGHGVQSKSQNYLIPVDAKLSSEAALDYESVNLNLPLDELANAKSKVNIVMLDACRNNDFSGKFRGGGHRGLAIPAAIPRGTVVVYATAPGEVASDGDGRNGLFTEGLRKAFEEGKDFSLDAVLTTASRHVEAKSNGEQSPYVNGPETLKKDFYFIPPTAPAVTTLSSTQTQAAPAARDYELEFWRSSDKCGTLDCYQSYLQDYAQGRFAKLALAQIKRLKAANTRAKAMVESASQPDVEALPHTNATESTGSKRSQLDNWLFGRGSTQ